MRPRPARPAVAAFFASLVNWHEPRKTLPALGFLGVTPRSHLAPEVGQMRWEARLLTKSQSPHARASCIPPRPHSKLLLRQIDLGCCGIFGVDLCQICTRLSGA